MFQANERMYRAWCVATGALAVYFMSGDNKEDFRRSNYQTFNSTPDRDRDIASKIHFQDLSDEEIEKQLGELKRKRNQS